MVMRRLGLSIVVACSSAVWLSGLGYSEEPARGNICDSGWVAKQIAEARKAGQDFRIIEKGSFEEEGHSYALAVRYSTPPEGGELAFEIFHGTGSSYQKIYEEQVGVALLDEVVGWGETTCLISAGRSVWFNLSAVDLDGDSRREIVVKSNAAGACSSCLSEVRVFQMSGGTAEMIVHETYSDLHFGHKKGLSIQSWFRGPDGEIHTTSKKLFVPK